MADKSVFYQKIKEQVKIVDFALEIGKTPVRRGKYYTLKENDSVMIDPVRNCFWRNSVPGRGSSIGKGGSVIDFALEFTDYSMYDIISMFSRRIIWNDASGRKTVNNQKSHNHKKVFSEKTLMLPKPDQNMHRVFAYLIQSRCISRHIVQEFVNQKMLYQDENHNCVFVGYDLHNQEKPVFACKRGTNTSIPFRGDVPGCDYDKCFYINNDMDCLIVAESVIDVMSIMTLLEKDWKKYDYLAIGGVGKWHSVKTYLAGGKIKTVIIATDCDEKGIETARIICSYIRENYPDIQRKWFLPPQNKGKDWNDVIRERSKKK